MKNTKKIQNGGKKLGQGGYGCVITPPINCLKNPKLRHGRFENTEEYISKIIDTKYREVAYAELNIGQQLTLIDKKNNFLVPFVNSCYFTPQKHPDLVYLSNNGRHISSSPEDSSMSASFLENNNNADTSNLVGSIPSKFIRENRNKCILSNDKDYLSLFGINAGENLGTILLLENNDKKITFIKNNYWYVVSYLIHGLFLLHSKNIIHKDIKQSNLVVNFNYSNNYEKKNIKDIKNTFKNTFKKSVIKNIRKIRKTIKTKKTVKGKIIDEKDNKKKLNYNIINTKFRYIDFGLSLVLNRRKYLMSDVYDLFTNGTHYYTPLEIFALRILNKLISHGHNIEDRDFLYLMMNKSGKNYQRNRDYYHNEGIRHSYFKAKNYKESTISNDESETGDTKTYFLTPRKYESVFKNIIELYKNKKLEREIPNLLRSWDIFSLGITLAKIIIKCEIHDSKLRKIVFKMINVNYEKRITINELIKLPEYIENSKKFSNFSIIKNV